MKKVLATAVALALAGLTGNAFAITDNEANASLPFSFSNPGARSLGMGGAFIGLADDASAAYTNPAGLTQLVSPEVSAELRSERTDTRWLDGGNVQFNAFNGSGLGYSSQNDTSTSLRSFSFVYPSERISFAFYRYELVNYDTDFESAGATWTTGDGSGINGSIFAYDVNTSFDVETYGAAMGIKATDSLSFGLGINYYRLDINSTTDRFLLDGTPVNREANFDGDGRFGFTLGGAHRGESRRLRAERQRHQHLQGGPGAGFRQPHSGLPFLGDPQQCGQQLPDPGQQHFAHRRGGDLC